MKFFPTTLTDGRLIAAVQKLNVLGTVAENGISVLVCKQKEKSDRNVTKRRQKKSRYLVTFVVIMIMIMRIITTLNKLAG